MRKTNSCGEQMWNRTKRLINSYLDELIERSSSPDREVRQVTRAEIARLNELEVQTLASVKMFEKELAEVELKLLGIAEREKISRERGDSAAAESAGRELMTLASHRDLLRQQISEAKSSAARSRALREERRNQGEDLATQTHLNTIRENLAGIQTPFDATDPSNTIEEMKRKLNRPATAATDPRLAEAEREYEEQAKRSRIDEMLSRYKDSVAGGEIAAPQPPQPAAPQTASGPTPRPLEVEEKEEPKTLGRNEGPMRPID